MSIKKWAMSVIVSILVLGVVFTLKSSITEASPGQTSACNGCHTLSSLLNVSTDKTAITVSPGQSFSVGISWSGGTSGRRTEINWPSTQSNSLFSPAPRIPYSGTNTSGSTTSTLMAPATTGTYTVRVFAARGNPRDTDYADVTVTVAAGNAAPVLAAIGNKSGTVGQLLQFTISATDPNGDPLTYSASGLPAGASFDAGTRTFSWMPISPGNYYNIVFTVTDGSLSDSETITITVNPALTAVPRTNSPPVLSHIGDKSVKTEQTLSFTIWASDSDGDLLAYSASHLPWRASFDPATRTFTWTPTSEQAGTYTGIHFEVTDGEYSASENIVIVVGRGESAVSARSENAPPVMTPIGDKVTMPGRSLQFTVSAVDPDGDPMTYATANLPAGASFNTATHTFYWRPSQKQVGTYRDVRFEVSDGVLRSQESITIRVEEHDEKAPEIDDLDATEITPDTVVIRWRTDEPSTSQVECRGSERNVTPLDESLVTNHEVRLTALTPGTSYRYRVLSRDSAGNLKVSDEDAFKTRKALTVSALSINPGEAHVGDEIFVDVLATNNLDKPATYELQLKAGDAKESLTSVDLAAREQRKVTFKTTRYATGTWVVDVNGATGRLVVGERSPERSKEFPGMRFVLGAIPLVLFGGVVTWLYRRRGGIF